jgi:hypothetical protein
MSHIISIGLPKTGTRSLMACLRTLGYTHSGDAFQTRRLEDWCSGNYTLDPEDVQDEPAFAFWRGIADAYPRTPFIMTVRDFESWYQSCQRNLVTEPRCGPKMPKRLHLEQILNRFSQEVTHELEWLLGLYGGGWSVDRDLHEAVWHTHRAQVLSHLDGTGRLLMWNLARDPSWEPLCAFLGHPVPNAAFPWKNRTARDE